MSENLRNYTKALYGFDHVARAVRPEQWDRASPCPGWTARHVVGHVLAVVGMVQAAGRDTERTIDPAGDLAAIAGADPYATWSAALDDVLEVLDHPGVLHHESASAGGREIDVLIGRLVGDAVIHTWDLARATGGDDRLDPKLVEIVSAGLERLSPAMRGPGRYGDVLEVDAAADAQTRMLALSGRQA